MPRWAFTQLPRVPCWGLHWSPGGTWKKRGGEEGRGQLSSYLKPDPAHPPRRKGGGEGGADCGETGRSWEVSQEMGETAAAGETRSPQKPKTEEVCFLPSVTLTLFLAILSLFSF